MHEWFDRNRFLRGLGCAAALLLAPSAQAQIAFAVDTEDDRIDDDLNDGLCHTSTNTCSLRAAIMQANRLASALTQINVPAGTYVLTRAPGGAGSDDNGDLDLTVPPGAGQIISISGAGAHSTVIDGNQTDRVFQIEAGRIANLRAVTIRNGFAPAPLPAGGGVLNQGTLSIRDCVIEGNRAISGGGISSAGTGDLTMTNTTMRANTALGGAGGAVFLDGPATLRDSTIHGNAAQDGGGIYTRRQLYGVNVTLSQNTANGNGGGIAQFNSPLAITALYNASIVDNDADHDADQGGGVGGGVYSGVLSRFLAVNTLIARNTLVDQPIYDDCNGILEVYGWNLLGELAGCTFSGNGTVARGLIALGEIDPLLRDNGGPTWTYALLAGSAAIDSTNDALGCVDETGATLPMDQRGAPRVAGARCDVGAFEYDAMNPGEDALFADEFE